MNEKFRSHLLNKDQERLDKSKDYNVKALASEEKKLKHMLHSLERQREFSKDYGKKLVKKISDSKKERFDPLVYQKLTDEEKEQYRADLRARRKTPAASKVLDAEEDKQRLRARAKAEVAAAAKAAAAAAAAAKKAGGSGKVPKIRVDAAEKGNELARIIERKIRRRASMDEHRILRSVSPRSSIASEAGSELPDIDPDTTVPLWMQQRASVAHEFAELLRQNRDFLFDKSKKSHDAGPSKEPASAESARKGSIPTANKEPIWKQFGEEHDEEMSEFMKKIHNKYGGGEELQHIQQYYQTLCEQEAAEAKASYGQSAASKEREKKKNAKKKMLALEAMLQQLPTNYASQLIEPEELLACRYLRLSNDNIEELLEQVWEKGIDPGIHAHMTEAEVEEYYNVREEEEKQFANNAVDKAVSDTSNAATSIGPSASAAGAWPAAEPGTSAAAASTSQS